LRGNLLHFIPGTHPPGPSHLIGPSGTFSPHPPFGHLLLKEKEIGIFGFLDKEIGIFTFLEKEIGIFDLIMRGQG